MIDDGLLNDYDSLLSMNEKDVKSMSQDFACRTVTEGRLYFENRRFKLLSALTRHWHQGFAHASEQPTIFALSQNTFKAELTVALAQDEIHQYMIQQNKTFAKAASLGPLESERMWK